MVMFVGEVKAVRLVELLSKGAVVAVGFIR